MSEDSAGIRPSWGYVLASGTLCGVGAAVLMGSAVAFVFFVDSLRSSAGDSLGSTLADALAVAATLFVYGSGAAAVVAVPAGLALGAVNGALVRMGVQPAVALLVAALLAMPIGALLPSLLFGGWSWLWTLAAASAGVAAETQVLLLLRRAGHDKGEDVAGSGDS